jgi:hypothetical protein
MISHEHDFSYNCTGHDQRNAGLHFQDFLRNFAQSKITDVLQRTKLYFMLYVLLYFYSDIAQEKGAKSASDTVGSGCAKATFRNHHKFSNQHQHGPE